MKHFAIAMVLCLSAASGLAQCSAKRVSLHKEANMSSAVVVATVTEKTLVDASWDFLDGFSYTVRVDSKLHGKAHPNAELTVFSENRPDSLEMYVGQQYVLYVQPKWGRNQVDGCGNSRATAQVEVAKQRKQVSADGAF
jgi:hypothetical protein